MERFLAILERKNTCYRGFHRLCSDFVDEIARGETGGLERFQKRRQALIQVLEQIEGEAMRWLLSRDGQRMPADPRIVEAAREKDSLLKSILDLDQMILAHIERIRKETIGKLQALQAGKKTIGAYKSPLESVERVENKKVDHEA